MGADGGHLSVTLEGLVREYERDFIGTLIFTEAVRAMRAVSKKRDPRVYGGGAANWADALDDAVQGFVERRLIAERQLDWVLREAASLSEFRALMVEQARRYLAKVRERTIVDQLLKRAAKIIEGAPATFEVCERRRSAVERFALAPVSVPLRDASPRELADGIRAAAAFPVTFGRGGERRAPSVYASGVLTALLVRVCEVLPCTVRRRDLHDIFTSVLTDWVVGDLEYIEAAMSIESQEPDPEVFARARHACSEFVRAQPEQDLHLLGMTLAGRTGSEIAKALGVSRQTVITRRGKLTDGLGAQLDGEAEQFVRCFFDEVALVMATRGIA